MEKLISIIIPVYNGQDVISRCLDSILNQPHDFAEIIVINDGSTDNTRQIVEEKMKDDSCIKLFNYDNSGCAAARNHGLDLAIGEYIWFIDADDFIHPKALKYLQCVLSEYTPKMLKVGFSRIESQENIQELSFPSDIERCTLKEIKGDKYLKNTQFVLWETASNWCYVTHRDSYGELRFDSRHFVEEDRPFNIRLILQQDNIVVTDAILYFYVQNNNSILHRRDTPHLLKRNASVIEVLRSYVELLDNSKIKCDNVLKGYAGAAVYDRAYRYVVGLTKLPYSKGEIIECLDKLCKLGVYPLKKLPRHEQSVNNRYLYHWIIFNIIRRKSGLLFMKRILKTLR